MVDISLSCYVIIIVAFVSFLFTVVVRKIQDSIADNKKSLLRPHWANKENQNEGSLQEHRPKRNLSAGTDPSASRDAASKSHQPERQWGRNVKVTPNENA